MLSRILLGLALCCLISTIAVRAQVTTDQEDIEIDPNVSGAGRVTDGTYTGHGEDSIVRDDLMLNDYGICYGTVELSEVLFVTADHWVLMEQNQPLGDGGRIKLWVDGERIGDHVEEICNPRGADRTCQNAGMPGELEGALAAGRMYGKIKASGLPFMNLRKIDLKHKRAERGVCD